MTARRWRFRSGGARLLRRVMMAGLVANLAAATAHAGETPPAGAATCAPPCAPGQVCLQGSCWIQAPRSDAPGPSGSPPPAGDSPQNAYSPPSAYPSPGPYPSPGVSPDRYPTYPSSPPDPGYATFPPPPHTPTPLRRRTRLIQLIPYAGVHSYHGAGATKIGPGLHLGGLFGVRFQEVGSLNGELTLDSVELGNLPVGEKLSEVDLSATFSPLFSVIAGRLELAFGPKVGVWLGSYSQSSPSRGDGTGTFFGGDLGANLAGVSQLGRHIWLGGLASFDVRIYSKSCFTPTRGREGCAIGELPPADKVVALSILLMFTI